VLVSGLLSVMKPKTLGKQLVHALCQVVLPGWFSGFSGGDLLTGVFFDRIGLS